MPRADREVRRPEAPRRARQANASSSMFHWGHTRGAEWLLEHGADPNAHQFARFGETALHGAVRRRCNDKLVRLLLDHGADPTHQEPRRQTASTCSRRQLKASAACLKLHGPSPKTKHERSSTIEADDEEGRPAMITRSTAVLACRGRAADRRVLLQHARLQAALAVGRPADVRGASGMGEVEVFLSSHPDLAAQDRRAQPLFLRRRRRRRCTPSTSPPARRSSRRWRTSRGACASTPCATQRLPPSFRRPAEVRAPADGDRRAARRTSARGRACRASRSTSTCAPSVGWARHARRCRMRSSNTLVGVVAIDTRDGARPSAWSAQPATDAIT